MAFIFQYIERMGSKKVPPATFQLFEKAMLSRKEDALKPLAAQMFPCIAKAKNVPDKVNKKVKLLCKKADVPVAFTELENDPEIAEVI